jgi:hypothetical protein
MIDDRDDTILKLDNHVINISTKIKDNECLFYENSEDDNYTQNYLDKHNNNLKIGNNNLSRLINNNTIYQTNGRYIYMNSIFVTEIIYRYVTPNTKLINIDLCFYINNPWSPNFYHFIVEILPYIITLSKIDQTIPILTCGVKDTNDIVSYFNIKNPIILRHEQNIYKTKKMIHMNSYIKYPLRENIDIVLSHFNKPIISDNIFYGIIINRSHNRLLLNISDLKSTLETKYQSVKWILLNDDMPFNNYINYITRAKIIIGVHGAGLTNMIFAPKDVIVIELMPKNFYNLCFSHLASQCDINNFHSIVLNDRDQYNNILLDINMFIDKTELLFNILN